MTRTNLTQLLANAAPAPAAAKPQAQPKGSPPEPVIPLDEAGTGEGLPADEEEPFDPKKEIDPKFSKRAAKVMNSSYWTAGIETAEEYRARAAEKAKLSDALTTARTFKELPAEAQVSFRKAEAKVGKKPGEAEEEKPTGNALDLLLNAFCPTGPGGGVDPTCSPGDGAASHGLFGKEWVKTLSPDERDAIESYALDSDRINARLRNGFGPNDEIDLIDEALSRSTIPKDTVLWRGMRHDPDYEEGDEFTAKAYISASRVREIAEDFVTEHGERDIEDGCVWELKVPKGANAADIRGVSKSHGSEAEILLPRESTFRVTGVREEDGLRIYEVEHVKKATANVFCPTGPGGGVDPTCSPGGISLSENDKEAAKILGVKEATYARLKELVKPATESDLDKKSIMLWHGTDRKGYKGITEDDSLAEGERGKNATISVEHAIQYPEDIGASHLVLIRASTRHLDVDPNDQVGDTVKEGLFPETRFESSTTVGKGRPVAVFDISKASDASMKHLDKGDLTTAVKGGLRLSWLRKKEKPTTNVFCPTGTGGGIDPTCSPGGTGGRANRPELVGKSRDAISSLIASGGKATAEQISEAISSLKQITVKDIEALRKEHGLTGTRARKDERIAALVAQASARVSDKEKVTREARAAGVKPAEVFALADDMHEQAKEHNALTSKMLKEARDQFKSEGGGKRLTRNHPAFKGGDPSQIKGFDKVARIMAGRYPELLGAHGYEEESHESASGKLFDYLAAGTPKLPPKSHWHRQAIEYLHEKKRLAREEVPF